MIVRVHRIRSPRDLERIFDEIAEKHGIEEPSPDDILQIDATEYHLEEDDQCDD